MPVRAGGTGGMPVQSIFASEPHAPVSGSGTWLQAQPTHQVRCLRVTRHCFVAFAHKHSISICPSNALMMFELAAAAVCGQLSERTAEEDLLVDATRSRLAAALEANSGGCDAAVSQSALSVSTPLPHSTSLVIPEPTLCCSRALPPPLFTAGFPSLHTPLCPVASSLLTG